MCCYIVAEHGTDCDGLIKHPHPHAPLLRECEKTGYKEYHATKYDGIIDAYLSSSVN